jgi:hypothetical protein
MADLVRFKDIFNNPDALSFKDMYTVEYLPGEDELVNYRAYRRKRTIGVGEGGPVGESYELDEKKLMCEKCGMMHEDGECEMDDDDDDVDEALTTTQSLKKARDFKKSAPRRKLGRERAKRKMADIKKLTKRANKQARNAYFLILSKGVPRSKMTFAQRAVIDKRMETPAAKTKIKRNARKMFPQIRKAEVERKKG